MELTDHHRQIYDDPSIGADDPGTGFDDYLATPITAEFVIGAYHRLLEIEMVFTQLPKGRCGPSGEVGRT